MPAELIESELFGHVRGSFTGATVDRRGLWQEADHGTVFLDEITETSLAFQVKLLRALQEGEIRRVGSNQTQRVDVRVIAATNRDAEVEVREGRFRQDLLFRLNAVTIHLPALRERREDMDDLAMSCVPVVGVRFLHLSDVPGHPKRRGEQDRTQGEECPIREQSLDRTARRYQQRSRASQPSCRMWRASKARTKR